VTANIRITSAKELCAGAVGQQVQHDTIGVATAEGVARDPHRGLLPLLPAAAAARRQQRVRRGCGTRLGKRYRRCVIHFDIFFFVADLQVSSHPGQAISGRFAEWQQPFDPVYAQSSHAHVRLGYSEERASARQSETMHTSSVSLSRVGIRTLMSSRTAGRWRDTPL